VVQYGAKNHFILSCNHILSVNGRVPQNTRIVSGAPCGPGKKPLPIATFLGEGYFVEIGTDPNPVDCALARLKTKAPPPTNAVKLGSPQPGTTVTKVGAASGTTHGIIVDTHADVSVDYSFGTFRFNDQILIKGIVDNGQQTEFAVDGDSGAIVVDSAGAAIGMVFAEAGEYAVACPLTKVFRKLGETLNQAPGLKGLRASLSIVKLA
jgi:hypothetical protein